MKFQLKNHRVFFIGVGIIFFFLLLNRFQFYFGSKTTVGTVVSFTRFAGTYYPVIRFEADDIEYRVKGLKDLNVTFYDTVEMIYQPSDPSGAVVNSFYGFWAYPILFCIIPLMLWISFVYSFITPKDRLCIDFSKSENMDNFASKFRFVSLSKRLDNKE